MPTLAAAYERATGVHLVTAFGSSATLAQQLANGAPQDVFLSADTIHAQQLITAGVALGPTPTPYAHGVLVLWARNDSPLQPISLDTLKDPRLTRLAIANPTHAPYGLAAQQALRTPRLLRAASAQTRHRRKHRADRAVRRIRQRAGRPHLAHHRTSEHFRSLGCFVRLPTDAYPPIQQSGVILKSSQQPEPREGIPRLAHQPSHPAATQVLRPRSVK